MLLDTCFGELTGVCSSVGFPACGDFEASSFSSFDLSDLKFAIRLLITPFTLESFVLAKSFFEFSILEFKAAISCLSCSGVLSTGIKSGIALGASPGLGNLE